jgi:hypothetical protein
MSDFVRSRLIRGLKQNGTILEGTLKDVSQEEAGRATDGPDGWSVLEVVCHLRDLEEIFNQRVGLILAGGNPTYPRLDVEAMARERRYADQDLRAAEAALRQQRRRFVGTLEGLTPEQWEMTGVHPVYGPQTIERLAFQTALHDVDHLDQITRCLGRADRFA